MFADLLKGKNTPAFDRAEMEREIAHLKHIIERRTDQMQGWENLYYQRVALFNNLEKRYLELLQESSNNARMIADLKEKLYCWNGE